MAVDEGQGTTITFGTSGFSANVTNIDWTGVSRESIGNSHLGTTTAKTFQPGDLYDPGEVTLTIYHDPATTPPISAAAETITITYPDANTRSASGFVTNWDPGSVTTDEMMESSITVKFTGAIT